MLKYEDMQKIKGGLSKGAACSINSNHYTQGGNRATCHAAVDVIQEQNFNFILI
jgi:hypothetical protein